MTADLGLTAGGGPELFVESDLRLMVDDAEVTVWSADQLITVHTRDVGRLAAQVVAATRALPVGSSSMRSLLGDVARSLDELGLSVRVVGSEATVIELGRGASSALGRLGIRHVRLGSTRELVQAGRGYLRATGAVPTRRLPVWVATAAGAIAIYTLSKAAGRSRRLHAQPHP